MLQNTPAFCGDSAGDVELRISMSSHAELARELSPAARSFVQRLLCADVTQVIIPLMPPPRWPPDAPRWPP